MTQEEIAEAVKEQQDKWDAANAELLACKQAIQDNGLISILINHGLFRLVHILRFHLVHFVELLGNLLGQGIQGLLIVGDTLRKRRERRDPA